MAKTWCERRFGSTVISCDGGATCIADALADIDVVGVCFTFAPRRRVDDDDDFMRHLHALHATLRTAPHPKRFQVVHVVLCRTDADVVEDDDIVHGQPWLAMPCSANTLKTKLARRYRIKCGAPTLVLLDNADGSAICLSAHQRLRDDPIGVDFPWRTRPLAQLLADVDLQVGGGGESSTTTTPNTYASLRGVRGFYFSAHWCPPCRAFTPQLAAAYSAIRRRADAPNFDIVFVSSDRSADSYAAYVAQMPWLAVPFALAPLRADLAHLFGVRGIPTLLLLDADDTLITMDARAELTDDPRALQFPWRAKRVNVLTERFAARLHDQPAIVLFIDSDNTDDMRDAETMMTSVANAYNHHDDDDDDDDVLFLIAGDSDVGDALRDVIGVVDDNAPQLVVVDLPRRRFAHVPITSPTTTATTATVTAFIDAYRRDALSFTDICTPPPPLPQLAAPSDGDELNE